MKDYTEFAKRMQEEFGFLVYHSYKKSKGRRKLYFTGHTGHEQDATIQRITAKVGMYAKQFFKDNYVETYYITPSYPGYGSINVVIKDSG